jgi:hypothetical protein
MMTHEEEFLNSELASTLVSELREQLQITDVLQNALFGSGTSKALALKQKISTDDAINIINEYNFLKRVIWSSTKREEDFLDCEKESFKVKYIIVWIFDMLNKRGMINNL